MQVKVILSFALVVIIVSCSRQGSAASIVPGRSRDVTSESILSGFSELDAGAPACKCNHIIRYVCGTDGVTYMNPCFLKCAQQVNPNLRIKHEGRC